MTTRPPSSGPDGPSSSGPAGPEPAGPLGGVASRSTLGSRLRSRPVLVALALLLQLVLLAVVVGPRLSARFTGEEYRLAVGPVDPVDPFRGAYVTLDYPGLPAPPQGYKEDVAFVPLVRDGALWKGAGITARRPQAPPYLACRATGYGWMSCGVESLFLPEDKARRVQDELTADRAAAVLRIDRNGNAAIVDVVPR
ncbi:GDYXXLXY domain-containing protein [Sphaerisporangium sp. TRM90804]|uniref:GDYXXLXY domain-containing protein n=1 Tax=Sphaerisporangium sp. TRM90804 TaxID=3031113 RepID=UPI00244D6CAC|nr:GDYXXLXY domain-containing protein [Sphaerisporangium sp. TRM90804]MDH2423866.1 GDYXXLXY domain-containing protein [Sphaerisporangium sp. TRM90804]